MFRQRRSYSKSVDMTMDQVVSTDNIRLLEEEDRVGVIIQFDEELIEIVQDSDTGTWEYLEDNEGWIYISISADEYDKLDI